MHDRAAAVHRSAPVLRGSYEYNLFAPRREPLRWVAFSFPEGAKCPDPSGGPRGP